MTAIITTDDQTVAEPCPVNRGVGRNLGVELEAKFCTSTTAFGYALSCHYFLRDCAAYVIR